MLRVIDRLNVGGPAKHVVWLTAGLEARGYETTLVTGNIAAGEGDMGYFAAERGVTPIVLSGMSRELGLGDVRTIFALVRILCRLRPDVVHTHKAKAGAVGRAAAFLYRWSTASALRLRPRRCRVVHTYHGHVFRGYFGSAKTALIVAIERALARITDRIVVLSEQQRREIHEDFRIGRAEQFDVVPLGIDTDPEARSAAVLRAELGLHPTAPIVAIVGRLTEVKNHALFLEAAARVLRGSATACREARFVVVGDGHLRSALESRAADLGIADHVTFTGFRRDAPASYPAFDVVALTSVNEGTPVTLLEAMSASRAVVATEVGGIVDILGARLGVRDGVSLWERGATVPSGDAEAFARALATLLGDRPLREEMGRRGAEAVLHERSTERLFDRMAAVYEGIPGSS